MERSRAGVIELPGTAGHSPFTLPPDGGCGGGLGPSDVLRRDPCRGLGATKGPSTDTDGNNTAARLLPACSHPHLTRQSASAEKVVQPGPDGRPQNRSHQTDPQIGGLPNECGRTELAGGLIEPPLQGPRKSDHLGRASPPPDGACARGGAAGFRVLRSSSCVQRYALSGTGVRSISMRNSQTNSADKARSRFTELGQ